MDGADNSPPTAANDLATVLFAMDIGARTTGAVTRQITDAVVRWALASGWSPRVEARVEAARLGFVDVVVRRGAGEPDLAIEIDSTDKPWSMDKLRHAAAQGMEAIWIRWGSDEWAGVYEDVDVIQLWWDRRPAHRRTASQLGLW